MRDPNNSDSECIFPRLCPLQPLALLVPQQQLSTPSTISFSTTTEGEIIIQTKDLLEKRDGESERKRCENDSRKEFLKCGRIFKINNK